MGGLGHYFMENPQGLEGRHGSQNSRLLKNRILGWSCPFHRHPPPCQSSLKFCLFLQGWGPAVVPGGAHARQGRSPP